MDIYKLITAILQAVAGLVLAGLSAYYYVLGNMLNFGIFLGVGVLFVALGLYSGYKMWKAKKAKDKEEKESNKQ